MSNELRRKKYKSVNERQYIIPIQTAFFSRFSWFSFFKFFVNQDVSSNHIFQMRGQFAWNTTKDFFLFLFYSIPKFYAFFIQGLHEWMYQSRMMPYLLQNGNACLWTSFVPNVVSNWSKNEILVQYSDAETDSRKNR